jgi:Na+/H+-dicarboxylate symporter
MVAEDKILKLRMHTKFTAPSSIILTSHSSVSVYTGTHRKTSETGQMAVCCQNLRLGALSSRSALSVPVGALFKNFGLFLNTPHIDLIGCWKVY